jgi:predicted phosphodiesterase
MTLTWLHLSDWHQRGNTFNRRVVREALVRDICQRYEISQDLAQIDFIVFSGDVAHSGKEEEYKTAIKEFFDPVLKATGLTPDRLLIVPGNHDLDRDKFDLLPPALREPFPHQRDVLTWLTEGEHRISLLNPFKQYRDFVSGYTKQENSDYAYVLPLDIAGKKVGLLGINSALMAGRNKNKQDEVDDYGKLIVGEPQIHNALNELEDYDLRIAVLHHPLEWLSEFDRRKVRMRLVQKCHFILCGHQHEPGFYQVQELEGNYLMIPAGASYATGEYPNSYNFVHLDFENQECKIYLRRWSSNHANWIRDDETYHDGMYTFCLPTKEDTSQKKFVSNSRQLDRKQLIKKYEELSDWKEQHKKWQAICTEVISLRSGSQASLQVPPGNFWQFRENWKTCKTLVTSLLPEFERFFDKRLSSEKYIISGLAKNLVTKVASIAETMYSINTDYRETIGRLAREFKDIFDKFPINDEENSHLPEVQDREPRQFFDLNESRKYTRQDIEDLRKSIRENIKILKEQDEKIERYESKFDTLTNNNIALAVKIKTGIAQGELQELARNINDILQAIDDELQKSITTFERCLKGEEHA